jgi:hypothetical protein
MCIALLLLGCIIRCVRLAATGRNEDQERGRSVNAGIEDVVDWELNAGLPSAFVWSKIAAEAGEGLATIIRRKEYERQLGAGLFGWGIGNALGDAVRTLGAEVASPTVIFSPMPSKPKKEDAEPRSVLLWMDYVDACGTQRPLPDHMVVTSRGHAGAKGKVRHYALFCHSELPLARAKSHAATVSPAALRNLASGGPLGASQVTAVVRRLGDPAADARCYPVAFSAALVGARYVRLARPRMLTDVEVSDLNSATLAGLQGWRTFVRLLRCPESRLS